MLRKLLLTGLMLLLMSSLVLAESVPSKVEKVIASGFGLDVDKARQNAVRNAVEQVVGSYVKSDTLVSNSMLIKDEILSHSGGFVKETKIISTERLDDGLISVKLEAVVVSTKLIRKLEDLNIAIKKVDNEGLFSAALSKMDTDRSQNEQTSSGNEMMEKVLKKFPGAAYKINIGELAVDSASDSRKTVKVIIPLRIRWDDQFVREFMETMKHTSELSSEFEDLMATRERFRANEPDGKFQDTYCFTEKSNLTGLTPEYCGVLRVDRADRSSYTSKFITLMRGQHKVNAKLKVSFKGDGNRTLKAVYQELKSDNYKQQKMDHIKIKKITSLSNLTYAPPDGNLPNGIDGPYGKIILLDGEYSTDVVTELSIDTIKKVKAIVVVIEPDRP